LKKGELTTGQFAKMVNLTKSELAHLDEIDLFSPIKRDKNGNKRYRVEQLVIAELIQQLMTVGVSPAEIKLQRNRNVGELKTYFEKKVLEIAQQIQTLTETKQRLIDLSSAPVANENFVIEAKQTRYFQQVTDDEQVTLADVSQLFAQTTNYSARQVTSASRKTSETIELPAGNYLIETFVGIDHLVEAIDELTRHAVHLGLSLVSDILEQVVPTNPADDQLNDVIITLEAKVEENK